MLFKGVVTKQVVKRALFLCAFGLFTIYLGTVLFA